MESNNIKRLLDESKNKCLDLEPTLIRISSGKFDVQLEALADYVTNAFDRGHIKSAKACLNLVNDILTEATVFEREYINKYFIQHLFWQATERAIEEGWPKIPAVFRKIYLDFHGAPPG